MTLFVKVDKIHLLHYDNNNILKEIDKDVWYQSRYLVRCTKDFCLQLELRLKETNKQWHRENYSYRITNKNFTSSSKLVNMKCVQEQSALGILNKQKLIWASGHI